MKDCGFETAKGVTAEASYAAEWGNQPKIWIL
jgi:hypothetical protein